jgi:hypothetical protein
MGCQESKTEEQREADTRNKQIEYELRRHKGELTREIKLLLLGMWVIPLHSELRKNFLRQIWRTI